MNKVLTFMVGDLFHTGHLNLLERASKLGKVIVGVPSSWQIEEYTKKKPVIISLEDRLRIISACKFVDYTFGYATDEDMIHSIDYIKPDIFFRGDDWKDFPAIHKLKRMGCKIVFFPYTKGISSTEIKEKICTKQC